MSTHAQASPPNNGLLLTSIFSAASQEFKDKVPDALVDMFSEIRTLKDLEAAIRDIEARQADRKSLRFLNKIKPCLHALNDYSKTIEVFVNAKPDIMAFVWGPIKACLLIASKYEKAFDSLLSAYVKIKAALPHFSAVEHLFKTNPQIQNVLGNVYKDILSFHLRALNFFTRPGWSIALRITVRALEDMFGDIFSNLESSKELLYSSASIAHYQAAQEARHKLEMMFKAQRETARLQRRAFVQAWLNAAEHHERHEQLCDLRGEYPQTAKWIFDMPCWKNWLNSEEKIGRMFWMSGIPGAGKTVIFSAMVEELMFRSRGNKSCVVAYLYCKYNDYQKSNFTDLARSLIYQLVGTNDICGAYLFDAAENSPERTASKRQGLMTIIQDVLQCYEEVWIGIDGLDECEEKERSEVIKLLKELIQLPLSSSSLHLFVTSQAERDIEKFMAPTLYRVKIRPEHLSKDIVSYVQRRSADLARFGLTDEEICDVNNEVSARSADMFLLARLIFDLFERCVTRSDFDEEYAGKGLPVGIHEAYGRIMSRVRERDESGRAKAKLVFEILSCAKRSLYVHELQGMLSMDTTNYRMDFSKRRYTHHFKDICGPLVELNSDGSIDLVHLTVKEYLDQYHSEYVSIAIAAFTSAKICTSYLSLDPFKLTYPDEKMAQAAHNGDFAFYKYAILQWLPHIRALQDHHTLEDHASSRLSNDVQTIYKHLSSFPVVASQDETDLQPTNKIDHRSMMERLQMMYEELWQYQHEISPIIQQISRIQTFIETAISSEKDHFLMEAYGSRPYQCTNLACSRFCDGFSTSQERDTHLKEHERQFSCTFQECVSNSVRFATQRALDAHIDAFHVASLLPKFSDLKPRSIWVTLQESIQTDDEGLVESLCVEAAKYPGKPSGLLGRAIIKGHFNSARALLRYFHEGDDLRSKHFLSRDLLKALAGAGEVNLTRDIVLLCHDTQWIYYEFIPALVEAISKRHKDMVTFFLEQARSREADCNYHFAKNRAQTYYPVIKRAALTQDGDELSTIVDRLGKDYLPLALNKCCTELAAEGSTKALKQVLPFFLEKFPLEVKKMKRFNKLQSLSLDDAVMQLTREIFENKNGNRSYKSMFQQAAWNGNIDELSRMLKQGGDINDFSGQFGSPLQAASRKGHVHVVRWLLQQGADVGVVGGHYGNAIAAAAAKGRVEILEMLLAAGQNASQEACAKMRDRSVKSVLSLVSSPTTATPLHFAVAEMQEETVQLLIKADADVTAVDSNGNTALHMSGLGPCVGAGIGRETSWTSPSIAARIRRSSVKIASLLLERGAIATAQNDLGNSPLHVLFIGEGLFRSSSKALERNFVHPCAVQIAKLLFEAGASFDVPNKAGMTVRDAVLEIGGQVLEDLKCEIPAAWEGYEGLGCTSEIDRPSTSAEPADDISETSSSGSDQEATQEAEEDDEEGEGCEEESSGGDDFDQDSTTSPVPGFSWNNENTSERIDVSCTPPDAMLWIATDSRETDIDPRSRNHVDLLPMGATYEASNQPHQYGNNDSQPGYHSNYPQSDLFMNPWEDA